MLNIIHMEPLDNYARRRKDEELSEENSFKQHSDPYPRSSPPIAGINFIGQIRSRFTDILSVCNSSVCPACV